MILNERQVKAAKKVVEGECFYSLETESEALLNWILRVVTLELGKSSYRTIDFKLTYKAFYNGLVICAESLHGYTHEFQTPFNSEVDLIALLDDAKIGINQLEGFSANYIKSKGSDLIVLEVAVER